MKVIIFCLLGLSAATGWFLSRDQDLSLRITGPIAGSGLAAMLSLCIWEWCPRPAKFSADWMYAPKRLLIKFKNLAFQKTLEVWREQNWSL